MEQLKDWKVELEELLNEIERKGRLCKSERKEVEEAAHRLKEMAKTLKELVREGSEEVLKKVFEEMELVETILNHVKKLELCEEELDEDMRRLVDIVKRIISSYAAPKPPDRVFKRFKEEEV